MSHFWIKYIFQFPWNSQHWSRLYMFMINKHRGGVPKDKVTHWHSNLSLHLTKNNLSQLSYKPWLFKAWFRCFGLIQLIYKRFILGTAPRHRNKTKSTYRKFFFSFQIQKKCVASRFNFDSTSSVFNGWFKSNRNPFKFTHTIMFYFLWRIFLVYTKLIYGMDLTIHEYLKLVLL